MEKVSSEGIDQRYDFGEKPELGVGPLTVQEMNEYTKRGKLRIRGHVRLHPEGTGETVWARDVPELQLWEHEESKTDWVAGW